MEGRNLTRLKNFSLKHSGEYSSPLYVMYNALLSALESLQAARGARFGNSVAGHTCLSLWAQIRPYSSLEVAGGWVGGLPLPSSGETTLAFQPVPYCN